MNNNLLKSFDLKSFINKNVIEREQSLFSPDILTYENEIRKRLNGKNIIVIGGAGTIGSSFIKAILKFNPAKLYVIDINENGLTELVRDLRSSFEYNIPNDFKTYPINFGDKLFRKILINSGPFQIVANFAAHKHVRSEKDHYSIEAMIDNNVIKAKQLLDMLIENPPERFFCVSTDKVANPVNIMGASKKIMEELILAYSVHFPISSARFANVAFSNGSLPDGFIQRLLKKQPLSAPFDVQRYFVSPEESGQICMLSCILGNNGDIFFPKLERASMKKFSDIGSSLLREIGYEPYFCNSEEEAKNFFKKESNTGNYYPVYYSPSDTAGEKQYEEFYTERETIDYDRFRNLGVIIDTPHKELDEINKIIKALDEIFCSDEICKAGIVKTLEKYISTFHHIETGKILDQKM